VVTSHRPGRPPEHLSSSIEITPARPGSLLPWIKLDWSPESPTIAMLAVELTTTEPTAREAVAARPGGTVEAQQ
jgi:hypothetical protein